MTRESYTTRTGAVQFRPVMTESEASHMMVSGDMQGFCLSCGTEMDGVEPDARRNRCEFCDEPKVYGLEELLMMGLLRIGEER